MAERLARRAQPLPELLIPVPLHRRRLMRRGYNQALELARVLKRTLALPVEAGAATRLHATPDQIGQTAAQRRRNLRNAFAVDTKVAGKHIALLDDVMTTGATLAALARAARKSGAAKIEVWALARAP
jgi:ComF family protein